MHTVRPENTITCVIDNPSAATPSFLAGEAKDRLAREVSIAFVRLLQTKHLYQSETVDTSSIEATLQKVDGETAAAVRGAVHPLRDGRWMPPPPDPSRVPPVGNIDDRFKYLWFRIGTVKLFCKTCKRVEPYNPVLAEDTTARSGYSGGPPRTIQVFTFSFLCQSCKEVPEVFVVRRHNLKLTLCGRAPMEHVPTPSFLPKNQQSHFADAIVAYNAGQILPALFMLRTTIEQFVREQYGHEARTPEELGSAFDAYMASLPAAFRSTFPSLKDLYARLSVALHSADASESLFESARAAIERHFDARRLFQLSAGTA
jgi:hypothetical protein